MSLGNKRAAAWSGPIGNMCVDKDARPRTSAREPPQERVRPPACAPPKLSLETLSHSRGRPPSMLSMDCVPLSPPLLVHAFHTTLSHTLPVFVIQLSLFSHTPAYPLPMHLSPSLSLPLLPSPSLSLSRVQLVQRLASLCLHVPFVHLAVLVRVAPPASLLLLLLSARYTSPAAPPSPPESDRIRPRSAQIQPRSRLDPA